MRRLDVEPDGLGGLAHHCSTLATDLLVSCAPQAALPSFQATAEATQVLHTSILTVNQLMHARLMGTAVALMTSEAGYLENETASAGKLAAIITTPGM